MTASKNKSLDARADTLKIFLFIIFSFFCDKLFSQPIIDSFAPSAAGKYAEIKIFGKNLSSTTAVSFGGVAANFFFVTSSTTISAYVGDGASGDVAVITSSGTAKKSGFIFIPPPSIDSFTPKSGYDGISITINGHNFASTGSVYFGNTSAKSFKVLSDSIIVATVGKGSSGAISVNTNWGSGSIEGFTFIGPVITSFTPTTGKTGSIITINGRNFIGTTEVSFGGVPSASFTVISPSVIKAVVGPIASGAISVTTNYGTATIKGFIEPAITSFSPTFARPDDTVTIFGVNLNGATKVTFGGTDAKSFNVLSDTSITATINRGSSGDVVVTTPKGTTSAPGFYYEEPKPIIQSFSPKSGKAGTSVAIKGKYFASTRQVYFGNKQAKSFTVENDSMVTAVVGDGETGQIMIETNGGTSQLDGFTFTGPQITFFSPYSAVSGDTVIITGTNFRSVKSVSFGGINASYFFVVSETQIKAVVGDGAPGDVSIITADGTAKRSGFLMKPIINSFAPVMAGRDSIVTIKGKYFATMRGVAFGDIDAKSFTLVSDSVVTAVVATGASGRVRVSTSAGAAYSNGFTFVKAPEIKTVYPKEAGKGDTIDISGRYFTTTLSVKFGNVEAASFMVIDDRTIKAIVASGSSGSIMITTLGGIDSTNNFLFFKHPEIYSFSPTSGSPFDVVTIRGRNLAGPDGVPVGAYFGGNAAAYMKLISDSVIEATISDRSSSGPVSVKNIGGTSNSLPGFTFIPMPSITSFSPTSGKVGDIITIMGNDFENDISGNYVFFNGVKATLINASKNMIKVSVPAGAVSGGVITLTARGRTSSCIKPFNVLYDGGDLFSSNSFAERTNLPVKFTSYSCLGDLNGDGKVDIVAENTEENKIAIYENISVPGNISFASEKIFNIPASFVIQNILDVNGDGKQDILLVSVSYSYVCILRNTSTNHSLSFAESAKFGINGISSNFSVADFNQDGRPDFAFTNYGEFDGKPYSIIYNRSSKDSILFENVWGKVQYASYYGIGGEGIFVGDLNNDNKPDLTIGSYYTDQLITLTNFPNLPALNTFFVPEILHVDPSIESSEGSYPQIADLNGDGIQDIYEYSQAFINNGSNNFSVQHLPNSCKACYVANDFDGDGKPDFYRLNNRKDTLCIIKNNSYDKMILLGSTINIPLKNNKYQSAIHIRLINDIDGDGKPDIILKDIDDETISILRNSTGEPKIIPSGNNPIAGNITKKISIDEKIQTYLGSPYVQRHYDIQPENNPETSTGTVTLYFLQKDFDNFNAYPGHGADLPKDSIDSAGVKNIRIYQYHGSSASGKPGTYSGNSIEIDPIDTNIKWNRGTQQWEITFDVSGFSGFFLSSAGNKILPIKLISFSGVKDGPNAIMKWQTAEEINTDRFELQKGNDGKVFATIAVIKAKGGSNLSSFYNYTDLIGKNEIYYYRLKMIDKDGSFVYSRIVDIRQENSSLFIRIFPNPTRNYITIEHDKSINSTFRILDITGRIIKVVAVPNNETKTVINTKGISPGIYKLQWNSDILSVSKNLLIE